MNASHCACSELPSQNPVLEAGVVRIDGAAPCGRAKALKPADLVAFYGTLPGCGPQLFWDSRDEPAAAPELVETEFDAPLPAAEEPLEVDVDTSDAERTAPDGGFGALVRAMQSVLLAEGATRAAALLGPLMHTGVVELSGGDDRAPRGSAPLAYGDGCLRLRHADEQIRAAWRRVLSGEEQDLSVCGSGTLDRWAAEIVAALLGADGRADEIRRELRRNGVAAFGMLQAA